MRLTSAVVAAAPQALNCLGDRELVLRNLAIPTIENLGQAKDAFDVIDLTANMISVLGDGFPPFPRLHTLYLAHNRVERVDTGLAASLPNLRTLILTANRIASVEALNLTELAKLEHLQVLCIEHNPIYNNKQSKSKSNRNDVVVNSSVQLRRLVVNALPNLTVFNFTKVSPRERTINSTTDLSLQSQSQQQVHTQPSSPRRRRKRPASNHPGVDLHNVDNAYENNSDVLDSHNDTPKKKKKLSLNNNNNNPPALTAAQSAAVRAYIENAASVEDVTRAQQAIRDGTVAKFLASVETKDQHTTTVTKDNTKENTDTNTTTANHKPPNDVMT